jgi:hypothetical protein
MASGMEMMIGAVLKSFGVNPDDIKREVLQRVAQFEHNVAILNATQAAILANQKAMCEHLNIPFTPPAIIEPSQRDAA